MACLAGSIPVDSHFILKDSQVILDTCKVYVTKVGERLAAAVGADFAVFGNGEGVDALSIGWQDVLQQRKRPLLGRPPLWYLLPLSRLNSING